MNVDYPVGIGRIRVPVESPAYHCKQYNVREMMNTHQHSLVLAKGFFASPG